MPYQAEINRRNPAAVLFLVDQSGSMAEKLPSGQSKAAFLADRLNTFLRELIIRCSKAEGVVDYYEVGVIGYGGSGVATAFSKPLTTFVLNPISQVEANPAMLEEVVKEFTRPVTRHATRTARAQDPYCAEFHRRGAAGVLDLAVAHLGGAGQITGATTPGHPFLQAVGDPPDHPIEKVIHTYCRVPRQTPLDLTDPELKVPLELECTVYAGVAPAEAETEKVRRTVRQPAWFKPIADGQTPMCEAFHVAARALAGWCDDHPQSFPPMVLHLTDGESSDGDPNELSRLVRQLATGDGQLLLFNLHISAASSAEHVFADRPDHLPDRWAKGLWEMSSPLPPHMLAEARRQGFNALPGARGFGYNAKMESIIRFIDIGTRAANELR